jgi:hypothetical protein
VQLIAETPERIRTIQRVTVRRQALTIRRYQDAKIDELCKMNVLARKPGELASNSTPLLHWNAE